MSFFSVNTGSFPDIMGNSLKSVFIASKTALVLKL